MIGVVAQPDRHPSCRVEPQVLPCPPHRFQSDDGFGGLPPPGRPAVFAPAAHAATEDRAYELPHELVDAAVVERRRFVVIVVLLLLGRIEFGLCCLHRRNAERFETFWGQNLGHGGRDHGGYFPLNLAVNLG
jgi:hypothetical protein